jgi:hypothetical protein
MKGRGVFAALALALSSGCGPAPHTRAAGAVSPLAVRTVDWNPAHAPLGKVSAVADGGDVVAVFSDRGATVFSARAAVATDPQVTAWRDAAAIPGADRSGQWIVGLSREGRLYHLRGLRALEDVTDRYGLGSAPVLAATPLGPGLVGFRVGREIAIADGEHVTHYASPGDGATSDQLAGGGGFGAAITDAGASVFDLARKSVQVYALPGVTEVAFGADGRLYATTARAVYAADARGGLALVYDAGKGTVHGLTVSGSVVWFADGDELAIVEGDHVAETTGARIGATATLRSSASGDVWVLAGGGLERFARVGLAPGRAAGALPDSIAPVFARSCSACHLPGGESGTDLSTAAAWERKRGEIRARVVERRTMPPAGHAISEEDWEAIKAWAR